jgi:hypothetical protein
VGHNTSVSYKVIICRRGFYRHWKLSQKKQIVYNGKKDTSISNIKYMIPLKSEVRVFFSRPDEHGGAFKWQRASAAWIGKSDCVFLGDTEGCFQQAAK